MPDQQAPEGRSVLDYALAYAKAGYQVLPVKPRSKVAAISEWQKRASSDPEQLRTWFEGKKVGDINLAVLADKLTIIDADTRNNGVILWAAMSGEMEGLDNAPVCISGGGGTHTYLMTPKGMTFSKSSNLIGEGIDLQTGNAYCLLPPSIHHETGREYEWLDDHGIDQVPIDQIPPMPEWLHKRANAVKVKPIREKKLVGTTRLDFNIDANAPIDLDEIVMEGGRNNAAARVAGYWLRQTDGDEVQSFELVKQWNDAKCRPPIGAKELRTTFYSIAKIHRENAAAGIQVAEFAEISDFQPAPPLDLLAEYQPVLSRWGADLSSYPAPVGKEIVDLYNASSVAPQPDFAVAAAIAFINTLVGRKYSEAWRQNMAHLYICLAAPSAAGKDWAKMLLSILFTEIGKPELVAGGYASRAGLYVALRDQPSHLALIDEFGLFLEGAKGQGNQHLKDSAAAWLELFSMVRGSSWAKRTAAGDPDRAPVASPALSILSLSTPETLWGTDAIDEKALKSGFVSRFSFVNGRTQRIRHIPRTTPQLVLSQGAKDWCAKVLAEHAVPGQNLAGTAGHPAGSIVPWTEEAMAIVDELKGIEVDLLERFEVESHGLAVTRASQKAMKVALGAAVARDPDQPVIDAQAAAYGASWTLYHDLTTLQHLGGIDLRPVEGDRVVQVVEAIERLAKSGVDGKPGVTLRELRRHCRPARNQKVLDEAVKSARGDGIEMRKFKMPQGKPRQALVVLKGQGEE